MRICSAYKNTVAPGLIAPLWPSAGSACARGGQAGQVRCSQLCVAAGTEHLLNALAESGVHAAVCTWLLVTPQLLSRRERRAGYTPPPTWRRHSAVRLRRCLPCAAEVALLAPIAGNDKPFSRI